MSLYSLLGVSRDATTKEIKAAYYSAALKLHPDKNKDNTKESDEMFQQIIDAYTVLINESTRREYDKNLQLQEEELQKNESMPSKRKQMIEELEMKEKLANSKKENNASKHFKYNEQIRASDGSYSFEDFEKIIISTLLNM